MGSFRKVGDDILKELLDFSEEDLGSLTYKEDIILPNYAKCSLGQKTMTYVLTGAFMKYGDYAQRSSMRPSTLTTPRIFFKQKR